MAKSGRIPATPTSGPVPSDGRPPRGGPRPRGGGRPPRVMGSSTPTLSASSRAAVVVATPSTTCSPMVAAAALGLRPEPTSAPKRRLRLWGPVAVRTRSPMPARPVTVSGRPPNRSTRRDISASPRVMRAALALWPSPRDSTRPRGDGQHVLEGSAQLDTGHVAAEVDAQARCREQGLELPGAFVLDGGGQGQDQGRREVLRDLVGEGRPRQDADRDPQHGLQDLGEAEVAALEDPLAGVDQQARVDRSSASRASARSKRPGSPGWAGR